MNPIAQPVDFNTMKPLVQEVQKQKQQEIDAEYVSISLPSGYKLYDFKDLYIKPFKTKHIRKLLQGQMNENTRYMIEVFNSCLSCKEGYTDLAYRLCREDFTYIQYWQRKHSMPSTPYTQMIHCTAPEHEELIRQGKMRESSLDFPYTFNDKLTVTNLENFSEDNLQEYLTDYLKELGVSLRIPRMQDIVEMEELAETATTEEVGEDGLAWYLSAIPALLISKKDSNDKEISFKEKFDIVDNSDPETMVRLRQANEACPDFGVKQTIQYKCPGCGALGTTQLVLNAHSFLPESLL